jgi:hypothetical protein
MGDGSSSAHVPHRRMYQVVILVPVHINKSLSMQVQDGSPDRTRMMPEVRSAKRKSVAEPNTPLRTLLRAQDVWCSQMAGSDMSAMRVRNFQGKSIEQHHHERKGVCPLSATSSGNLEVKSQPVGPQNRRIFGSFSHYIQKRVFTR